MPVYSHSKLATYENCPQKYKLQYIDRIELPEGEEGSLSQEKKAGKNWNSLLKRLGYGKRSRGLILQGCKNISMMKNLIKKSGMDY